MGPCFRLRQNSGKSKHDESRTTTIGQAPELPNHDDQRSVLVTLLEIPGLRFEPPPV